MLTSLLVVLLVEPAHQLLEDRAHAVVVKTRVLDRPVGVPDRIGAQVDIRRGELLDQGAQGVGPGEPRDLVAELEVLKDVLHARREAVEVVLEVGHELLAIGPGPQLAHRELRGVVESLARGLSQRLILLHNTGLVKRGPHLEDSLLAVLQNSVQAAQHRHRQDHVTVLPAHVEITQNIVRDPPDEADDACVLLGVHPLPLIQLAPRGRWARPTPGDPAFGLPAIQPATNHDTLLKPHDGRLREPKRRLPRGREFPAPTDRALH